MEPTCISRDDGTTLREEQCRTCGGNVRVKIHPCTIWGECSLSNKASVQACGRCVFREPIGPPGPIPFDEGKVVRNFFFHIWPIPGSHGSRYYNGGVWKANVGELIKRWHLFNGKKIVAVAEDPTVFRPESVKEEFGHLAREIEWLVIPNDKSRREVATFKPALDLLESLDPNEITAVCHAKGVTRGDRPEIHEWRSTIWRLNFDYVPLVERSIAAGHATCGPFKKRGGFPLPQNHDWHYSGSFFWFRNRELFQQDWTLEEHWSGIESFVGRNWAEPDGGVIGPIDGGQEINCYEPKWWNRNRPLIRNWENHARKHLGMEPLV